MGRGRKRRDRTQERRAGSDSSKTGNHTRSKANPTAVVRGQYKTEGRYCSTMYEWYSVDGDVDDEGRGRRLKFVLVSGAKCEC